MTVIVQKDARTVRLLLQDLPVQSVRAKKKTAAGTLSTAYNGNRLIGLQLDAAPGARIEIADRHVAIYCRPYSTKRLALLTRLRGRLFVWAAKTMFLVVLK